MRKRVCISIFLASLIIISMISIGNSNDKEIEYNAYPTSVEASITNGSQINYADFDIEWISSLGSIYDADYSNADNRILLATSSYWTIVNASTGQILMQNQTAHHDMVLDASWSPNGTQFSTVSSDNTVKIWNSTSGFLEHKISIDYSGAGYFKYPQWSPGGGFFAISSSPQGGGCTTCEVRIFNTIDWSLHYVFNNLTSSAHSTWLNEDTLLVSSVNTTLQTNYITFLNITSLEEESVIQMNDRYCQHIVASPDSSRFACHFLVLPNYTHSLRIWNASNPLDWSDLYAGTIVGLTFSPNSSMLAVLENPPSVSTIVTIWDIRAETILQNLTYPEHPWSATWSSAGDRILVSAKDISLQEWETNTFSVTNQIFFDGQRSYIRAADVSPGGDYIVTAGEDNSARILFALNGTLANEFPISPSIIYNVAWSPDGTYIAFGGSDRTIRLHDPFTGGLLDTLSNGNDPFDLDFSTDGAYLLAPARDGPVNVWNTSTWVIDLNYSGHDSGAGSADWSDVGPMVASTSPSPGRVDIWNPYTGELIDQHLSNSIYLSGAAISPDGEQVLVSNTTEFEIWMWNRSSNTSSYVSNYQNDFGGHIWKNDGSLFLTSEWNQQGYNNSIFVMDPNQMEVVSNLYDTTFVNQFGFLPDERSIYTANYDGTVRMFADRIPPNVVSYSPLSSVTSATAFITLEFREFMNKSSVESAFNITPFAPVDSFSWSADWTTVEITFSQPLAFNTTYNVTIRDTAMDTSDNRLDGDLMGGSGGNFSFEFTTVSSPTHLPVQLGWNLISLPVNISGTPGWVLSDDIGDDLTEWSMAFTYSNGVWRSAVPARPAYMDSLSLVTPVDGIWVNISSLGDGFLTFSGPAQSGGYLPLVSGWSLVGYPTINSSVTVASSLSGLAWDRVETGNGSMLVQVAPTEPMVPGKGYWIHLTVPGIWDVDP